MSFEHIIGTHCNSIRQEGYVAIVQLKREDEKLSNPLLLSLEQYQAKRPGGVCVNISPAVAGEAEPPPAVAGGVEGEVVVAAEVAGGEV